MSQDDVAQFIGEAIAAIQAGKRAEARFALTRALSCDPKNELAWLWMSAAVDSPDAQQVVLQRILEINPANRYAREGLEALKPPAPPEPPSLAMVIPDRLPSHGTAPLIFRAEPGPDQKAVPTLAHTMQPLSAENLPAHSRDRLSSVAQQPDLPPREQVAQPAIMAHTTQPLTPDTLPAHPHLAVQRALPVPEAPAQSSAEVLAALATAPLPTHASWLLDDLSRRAVLRDQAAAGVQAVAAEILLAADPNPEHLPRYPGRRHAWSLPAPIQLERISAAIEPDRTGAVLQSILPRPAERRIPETVLRLSEDALLVAPSLTGPGVALAQPGPAIDSWELGRDESLVLPVSSASPPTTLQPLSHAEQIPVEPLVGAPGRPIAISPVAAAGAGWLAQPGAEWRVAPVTPGKLHEVQTNHLTAERPGPASQPIRRAMGASALAELVEPSRHSDAAALISEPALRLWPGLSPELPMFVQSEVLLSAALAPDLERLEVLPAFNAPGVEPLRHQASGFAEAALTSSLPPVSRSAQPIFATALALQPIQPATAQASLLPTSHLAQSTAPLRGSAALLSLELERQPAPPASEVLQNIAQIEPNQVLPVLPALSRTRQPVDLTFASVVAVVTPGLISQRELARSLAPATASLTQAPEPAIQDYSLPLDHALAPTVLSIAEPIAALQPLPALAESGLEAHRVVILAGLALDQPHAAAGGGDFIAELGLEEDSVAALDDHEAPSDDAEASSDPELAQPPQGSPPAQPEPLPVRQEQALRLNFLGEVVSKGSVAEPPIAAATLPLVVALAPIKVPTLNPGPQPEIVYIPAPRALPLSRWSNLILWSYLLLIMLAEYLTAFFPQIGLSLHAVILLALVAQASLSRNEDERNLCLGLTLAPLIRMLSLSLPLPTRPQIEWYPLVSVPLLMGAWIVVRQTGLTARMIGLRKGDLRLQLMLVGLGFGLGAIEYVILQPKPILASFSIQSIALAAVTLTIFTGFTEEIIFRGVLQRLAAPLLRSMALIYVSVLFAVLHIGYVSVADVIFVFMVGWLFASIVEWSNSILGVTLAHGLTNVNLFLVMPFVYESLGDPLAPITWIVAGGTIMSAVAIVLIYQRAQRARYVPQSFPAYVYNLRRLRLARRLSRKTLAQQAGISVTMLVDLERGRRPITPSQLARLARAFGISLHELTSLSDDTPPALSAD